MRDSSEDTHGKEMPTEMKKTELTTSSTLPGQSGVHDRVQEEFKHERIE